MPYLCELLEMNLWELAQFEWEDLELARAWQEGRCLGEWVERNPKKQG